MPAQAQLQPGQEGYQGEPDAWSKVMSGIRDTGGLLPPPEPGGRSSSGAWSEVMSGIADTGGVHYEDEGVVASPRAWQGLAHGWLVLWRGTGPRTVPAPPRASSAQGLRQGPGEPGRRGLELGLRRNRLAGLGRYLDRPCRPDRVDTPVQSVLEASAPNSAGDGGKATDDQWSTAFGIGKIAVDAEQPVAPAVPKPSPKPKRPSPSEASVDTWGRPHQFRARKVAANDEGGPKTALPRLAGPRQTTPHHTRPHLATHGASLLYHGMVGKRWRDMLSSTPLGSTFQDPKALTLAADSKMIDADVTMEIVIPDGIRSVADKDMRTFEPSYGGNWVTV